MTATSTWLVTTLAATVLVGCSDAAAPAGRGTPGPLPADAATTGPRCFSGLPDRASTSEHAIPVAGGEVAAIGFRAVDADVAMVLLHQTGNLGACGWGRFAAAAQARGISSLAIDQCGYGLSTCPDDGDRSEVVDAATGFAKDHFDVDRVVLVGASMGGNDAVAAVSHGVDVDAWVDVSGPDVWGDVRLTSLPWSHRSPDGLVMYGADEPPEEVGAARRLARASGATFVLRPAGHGYELLTSWRGRLTDGGRRLLRFAARSS